MPRLKNLLVTCLMLFGITTLVSAQTPEVKVGGTMYTKFYWNVSDENNRNNFELDRAYINVNAKFAHGLSARITPDIYSAGDGSLALRLKYGYAAWNKDKSPITLKFGVIQTPYIDFVEHMWDYRMQGPVAMDRSAYLSSADVGFSVDGNFGFERLNFTTGVYNGEYYNKQAGDKGKDFAARVSYRLFETDDPSRSGGVRATVYGHYGTPTTGGERSRVAGMVSYKSKLFTLAGEFAGTVDSVEGKAMAKGTVSSVFGVVRVPNSKFGGVLRYDYTDRDNENAGGRSERIIGGVSYTVSSNLRALVDVDHTLYEDDVAPTPELYAARTRMLLQLQITF